MARLPEFFGIDIGSSAVKVCKIKMLRDKYEVQALGSIDVPFSFSDNRSEQGMEILSEKITEVVKNAKIRTKAVVTSLQETTIFSRLVTLPTMREGESDEAIHWAIKPLVPVPLDTLNVSYLKIDEVKRQGKKFGNWYVVAAPKDIVQRYELIMSRSKLQLLAIETESLAVARLLAKNYQITKDSFIVDIGSENTNLIIVRKGIVIFSQSVATGSSSFTKIISSDYGLDESQAENYKISFGLDFESGEGKIAKSLVPVIDIVISEITRTMAYYTSKIGGQKIQKIFITGGGSNLLKLDEYIYQKTGIQVEKISVLKNGKISAKLLKQYNQNSLSTFNVAVGLSLKGVGE